MLNRPPMIRTDASNAFAHHTMQIRTSANIREIIHLNPDYPAKVKNGLEQLAAEVEADATIRMIEPLAPDYERWLASYTHREGDSWHRTDWLYAEHFVYRHIAEITRWWETGRDPFTPKKEEELASPTLRDLVERAATLRDRPLGERLDALLMLDLWGNRMDLSFAAVMAHGTHVGDDDLLVDDSAAALACLQHPGRIHLIADNTGTELAMDLLLIEALLDQPDRQVILHVKMHPTFVSDAIVPDVHTLIERFSNGKLGSNLIASGQSLVNAFESGRLRVIPDFFWNSALTMWDMPAHFHKTFRDAALVMVKGDANYRRLLGDALWPSITSFAAVLDYFPAPLVALRTLKSDPIVGLPNGTAEALDTVDARWRVNGKRGIIQFKP
ncbi:MAG TPA: damage-control phosphatase ARMT1 family protein [Aggregatilineales bacterium]|nr:damage-control phosphatase ARMT1 family protein [Aggregatilineales bacterium]